MPYYPYKCLDCRKRFDEFMTYSEYGTRAIACPNCHSTNVQRRVNRVRIARSDDSRMDNMDNLGDLDGLEDDPRALGRMMRKMGQEMGEEMDPEFHEVIDRLEAGQSPEEIESALPNLAGDDTSGGLGGADDF